MWGQSKVTVRKQHGGDWGDERWKSTRAWQATHFPEWSADTHVSLFQWMQSKKKKTKNTMTLICCSYFNHKAADYTSLQAVIMWAPPEKIFITKGSVQVALTLTSCQLHKSPGVLCSQHWHCSCLHIPHGGPLSSQHPAPGLHNATYVHVGSMCEKEREVGGGGKGRE